ncbi:MAG: TIGR02147 family protein [Fibrobacterales bacterium]
MSLPSVFDYYNYRHFLRDYYNERKSIDKHFSHRSFAMRAGYNSSGLYNNIVKGKNNLSSAYVYKFNKALGLKDTQARYFELLVAYAHELNQVVRDDIFDEMLQLLPPKTKKVRKDQLSFFSKWHHVALHQALGVIDFKDDVKELASFIQPPLKSIEVRNSIKLLKKLNLVLEDSNGFLRPSEVVMIGAGDVGVGAIHNYQGIMMDRAKEALRLFTRDERHVVTQTVAASAKVLERIKAKIDSIQKEIINIIHEESEDHDRERVFQLNIQFFPMCKKKGGEE